MRDLRFIWQYCRDFVFWEVVFVRKITIRTLYIELTSACNLKCRYCYNKSGEGIDYLEYDQLVSFINSIKPYWSSEKREVFLSGGEPLLYDKYFDVIVETHKLGHNVYLVTNGCSLTFDVMLKISPYIKGVQISLDGCSPDVHDYFRGEGSFCKTVKNMRSFNEEMLKKIRTRISIGKKNCASVIDYIDFCRDLGIAGVQFGLIRKQGRGRTHYESIYELSTEEIYNLKFAIDEKKEALSAFGFDVGLFDVEGGNCILTEENPLIDMRIDSFGDVYPCHGFYSLEFRMGNIFNNTVKEIFDGEKTHRIFDDLRERRKSLHDCQKCMWREHICHGGCPAVAYMLFGDIYNLDDKCDLRSKFWRNIISQGRH